MREPIFRRLAMAIALAGFAVTTLAPVISTAQQQIQVRGRDLMSQQEMLEYQERMRAAGSETERQQIRQEHHVRMQERSKQQGVTVPDQPSAQRMGRGGSGSGLGAGSKARGYGGSGGGGRNQ